MLEASMLAWITDKKIFSAMTVWPRHVLDLCTLEARQPLARWELKTLKSNKLKFQTYSLAKNLNS
jgi:hypothetical protein